MTNKANLIATLNDRFRAGFLIPSFGPRPIPGLFVCTAGIATLPQQTQICIWKKTANFGFSENNDPHGEHDFGAFDTEGQKIFWRIDCYSDASCTTPAENRADPAHCFRVLIIMLLAEHKESG